MNQYKISVSVLIFLIVLLVSNGCKKFLNIDPPKSKIIREVVFEDDITATQAVLGMYNSMYSTTSFSSGSERSVVSLCGMSADEILRNPRGSVSSSNYYEFDENRLTAQNPHILGLWTSMYKIIYQANDILEGLSLSQNVSEQVSTQLKGEALTVRAFCYFYLVNLFGNVPLALTTDVQINSRLPRTPKETVLTKIVEDLVVAKNLLSDKYVTENRVRPNKAVATSLLARLYLYSKEWEKAETQATEIISNNGQYMLSTDLVAVFLVESTEAIWQLFPGNSTNGGAQVNAQEGANFIPASSSGAPRYILTNSLLDDFELGDLRKSTWVAQRGSVYYPFKYKVRPSTTISEYSVILRLAEIYLIRAEARAQLDNLDEAIGDLDMIRGRAGLELIAATNPLINKDELIMLIHKEKRIEYFAEWGHRWLDLNRTGRTTSQLSPLKNDWSENDTLYPIPQVELSNNPFLENQNLGY